MQILEYIDLDTSKVKKQYEKVISYISSGDFASASVKKFPEHDVYCARLDDSNRLLFKLIKHGDTQYALMLEVILNHAYDKSKFLRGTKVDESKIPVVSKVADTDLTPVTYINKNEKKVHIIDKIISFDSEQTDIYYAPLPLIIIGPAGSGKTALTLAKMKRLHGEGIYVTLSGFLAENARKLYYLNNYENEHQSISFLSFREYLETYHVPEGREINFKTFASWLNRYPKHLRVSDANKLYEEFRGVLTGSVIDSPYLSKEQYLNLGVRQSIYLGAERELVYGLFEKYLVFLKENNYYDPNILAYSYLKSVSAKYDFVVIDEVQDMTNIQLLLVLKSLKSPDNFLLSGDSNQIVHPNFFSWSALKTMLYKSEDIHSKSITRLLHTNYRSSKNIISLANTLMKIKQKRFGSIDKESSYIMNSVSNDEGKVFFLKDSDKLKSELNKNIRLSTKYAVIVMRDEDKLDARRFFSTPLLFSIYEAKGLEYENVILLNFVSKERQNFTEICSDITPEDLQGEVKFMRASDKSDKSLEAYKFYINSFYVAITRAVKNLFIIESDTENPTFRLLGLNNPLQTLQMKVETSSKEDWQAEAMRLQTQGKQEQADEIRRTILNTQAVSWDVLTMPKIQTLIKQILTAKDNPQKPRKILFDYALLYNSKILIDFLSTHNFDKARQISFKRDRGSVFNYSLLLQQRTNLDVRYFQRFSSQNYHEVLRQCELYGVDHRTEFNLTPLMLASRAGNVALIKELLKLGADLSLVDNFGWTAWHMSLYRFLFEEKLSEASIAQVCDLITPASISLKVDDRLIKLDSKSGEFIIFSLIMLISYHRFNWLNDRHFAVTAGDIELFIKKLPDNVVYAYRKKRTYITALLSKNEVNSQSASKKLFTRIKRGEYILNPEIQIRCVAEWVDLYEFMGLDFLGSLCSETNNPTFFKKMLKKLLAISELYKRQATMKIASEDTEEDTTQDTSQVSTKDSTKSPEVAKQPKTTTEPPVVPSLFDTND